MRHIIVCLVLKVKSYLTIIEKKWDKTEKGQMRNFLLNYLRYRDLNQIIKYTTGSNRIKGSFD